MNKLTAIFRLTLKRISDPVFFIALLFATLLWLITKLNHGYTDTIRIPITINNEEFGVSCTVQGDGYSLLMDNLFPRTNAIKLNNQELTMGLTPDSAGYYHIAPAILYNAISAHVKDIRVINVTTPILLHQ